MSKIKVKLLNEDCMPERTHRWDAGWDLKATESVVIPVGEVKKVHTGVIIEIPPRHCGMVVPRSSLGTKHGITLTNTIGIIDSEYRGEIMVFLTNNGKKDYEVCKGDRFAQLVVVAIDSSGLMVVDRVSETQRGSGGFGSTTSHIPAPFKVSENDDKLVVTEFNVNTVQIVKDPVYPDALTPVEKARLKVKNNGK